jgi:hypothetical protein
MEFTQINLITAFALFLEIGPPPILIRQVADEVPNELITHTQPNIVDLDMEIEELDLK